MQLLRLTIGNYGVKKIFEKMEFNIANNRNNYIDSLPIKSGQV